MVLPFRLKVPGTDEFRGLHAVSTSFRFRGMLRFDGISLTLEWSGVANVQDVGPLTARDDRLPLPTESLAVPLAQLQAVRLTGGWWRPRLEIVASHLDALTTVPSEDAGTVRLWLERRDLGTARTVAASLRQGISGGHQAE